VFDEVTLLQRHDSARLQWFVLDVLTFDDTTPYLDHHLCIPIHILGGAACRSRAPSGCTICVLRAISQLVGTLLRVLFGGGIGGGCGTTSHRIIGRHIGRNLRAESSDGTWHGNCGYAIDIR